jgi:hypothetical protein
MTVATLEPSTVTLDAGETFLAPGQRYLSLDKLEQVTVAKLVRDSLGLLHVTMRTASGRELSAFARQVEDAISDGALVPFGAERAIPC